MTRSIMLLTLALASAGLMAGDHADDVKDLGDSNKAPAAMERLANADDEAFDDLLEGLKQNPDEAGIKADEKAARSERRLACARLLGAIGDTRASSDLVLLLESQAVENPAYPILGAACASSLGRLWSEKEAGADRNEIVRVLTLHAANHKLDTRLRWGSLHGLAAMKAGGTEAAALLGAKEGEGDAAKPLAELLRSACIEVIVATAHKAGADALLDIWETQRLGPKGDDGKRAGAPAKDYAKPLGLQALFALAALEDTRCVAGLVDVTTMSEFANLAALREQAVRDMKAKALEGDAIRKLVETFKDVDAPIQRSRASQTLGDLGASGVTAFLDIADDEAPKPKEGEPADKYPADYYAKQVDMNLTSLRSDEALKAFVDAYAKLPAEAKSLREKIIDHLLANKNSLKEASVGLFRTAADDEALDAAKRANAVNAWAEAKGKEAFDDLSRWAKSTEGVIRAQAVQNLGRSYIPLAKSMPLLKETLADKDEKFAKARENALQGLQRSDDKELLPLFIDSLDPTKEASADTRNAALKAIDVYRRNARVEDDDVFPAVKARTGDTDENVRATAVGQAARMATLMGNKTEAVEIIEKALTDNSSEVRLHAYGQVNSTPDSVDAAKVMKAALLEDSAEMKGHAVSALSKLSSFGTETDKQKLLVDMALSVIEDRVRQEAAKTLLDKLADGALFNDISEKVRARIEAATSGGRADYVKLPVLIKTLIAIQDNTYFTKIEELAAVPNVELRKACVEYISTFGTKKDVPFLRTLNEKTDNAALGARAEIEVAIARLQDQ